MLSRMLGGSGVVEKVHLMKGPMTGSHGTDLAVSLIELKESPYAVLPGVHALELASLL